jgi:hypothetical protein
VWSSVGSLCHTEAPVRLRWRVSDHPAPCRQSGQQEAVTGAWGRLVTAPHCSQRPEGQEPDATDGPLNLLTKCKRHRLFAGVIRRTRARQTLRGPSEVLNKWGERATAHLQDICPGGFPGCVADRYKIRRVRWHAGIAAELRRVSACHRIDIGAVLQHVREVLRGDTTRAIQSPHQRP